MTQRHMRASHLWQEKVGINVQYRLQESLECLSIFLLLLGENQLQERLEVQANLIDAICCLMM